MNRSSPWIVILGLLTIGYLLQLNSPLRTNTDATCFLQMGASASDGLGYTCCKNARHYPIGYPALLSTLDRAGVACSATLVGINLLGIAAGLVASGRLLRTSFGWSQPAVLFAAVATMLNWVLIKHVTLPLTDIPYFGISTICLVVLSAASRQDYPSKLPALILGLLLMVVCISVRTVGIALIPAFAFAIVSGSTLEKLLKTIRTHRIVATGLVLLLGTLGAASFLVVSRTNYFRELLENWAGFGSLARMRLDDWGELVLNTSMAKVPAGLQSLQLLAGMLGALLILIGFAKRRRVEIVDLYMAGYLTILFVWPYRDARFWIPVFPLLLAYAGIAVRPYLSSTRLRWTAPLYLTAYSLLGLVALGYSSWLSFSGDKFGDRFAGGVYRDSYRAAFEIGPGSPPGQSKVDPQLVRLLERYRLDYPTPTPRSVASSGTIESR